MDIIEIIIWGINKFDFKDLHCISAYNKKVLRKSVCFIVLVSFN